MSQTLLPQGAAIDSERDYPRLVFAAPYFTVVPIAEIIEPSVQEAVEGMLPSLVPPFVNDAANAAVANLAVLLTGSTMTDRKSTRLNSSHLGILYGVIL